MNLMQMFYSQPWVERLGWTLVHFFWQGLLIALFYAGARRAARASSANVRYLLACAALVAMTAAPLVTWGFMRPGNATPDGVYGIRSTPPPAAVAGGTALPGSVVLRVPGVRQPEFLPWVVMVWLGGALVLWARMAGGWVIAARMRSTRVRSARPEWQEILRKLGARIGVSRPVKLLVSALVEAPTVVGWLRPVVLMPVGALSGLPPEHLESLLLHELAHIRRHDYLVNILQSVAEALLFYHPAVWWVSGHIRAERELCCDDVAASVSGDAFTYARALAQLEGYRPAHAGTALAANGGSLSYRIARLLGEARPAPSAGFGPGVLAVAILLVTAAYGLFAQSDAHPTFQVASIKKNTSKWNERFEHPMGGGYQPGGRMVMRDASLLLLIQFAYAARDNPMAGHSLPLLASQVVGGPPWINSEGYDIEAQSERPADPRHTWLMLQTLLADRFRLALHRETRELPIYVLTAASNGVKLPAAKDVDCVAFPPGTTPRPIPGKVDCGYVAGPMSGASGELRLEGSKIHMADLIRQLASVMDRPVLDRTEFSSEFDLDLKFRADDTTRGIPEIVRRNGSDGPNIFAALQEQLGLELAPAKGPVEVLVVDHAEKPVVN